MSNLGLENNEMNSSAFRLQSETNLFPTSNGRIGLAYDIIQKLFDDDSCFEVRAVFLNILNASDKIWHEGLIFKLQLNGI